MMKDQYAESEQGAQPGFAVQGPDVVRIITAKGRVVLEAVADIKSGHGFVIEPRPGLRLSAQFGHVNDCARKSAVGDYVLGDMKTYWSPDAEVALLQDGELFACWGSTKRTKSQGYVSPGAFVSIAIMLAGRNWIPLQPVEAEKIRWIIRNNREHDQPEKLAELLEGVLVGG
jgi:hypothetical protein